MAEYNNNSPWSKTPIINGYLGNFKIRAVSAESDDQVFTITTSYAYRPDLLSYDLYGTTKLWWVFMQRNMDVISDPIYDFIPGTIIRLPKRDSLFKVLGL